MSLPIEARAAGLADNSSHWLYVVVFDLISLTQDVVERLLGCVGYAQETGVEEVGRILELAIIPLIPVKEALSRR